MDQIPDYFECIIKKHETIINNSPIQIYINRIKNSVACEKIDKDKNCEHLPKLELVQVVLTHCN